RPDPPDVAQLAVVGQGEEEGADLAGAGALPGPPADDDGLLGARVLDLQPRAAAPPRRVGGVAPLGHDALELPLAAGRDRRLEAAVEGGRDLDAGAPAGIDDLLEHLPPLVIGPALQARAVDRDRVEKHEAD